MYVYNICIHMSTVPGMYVICHQIHQKNLLGPNPTCNSTGSKVTFGKRTSELRSISRCPHRPPRLIPTQPRCIVCHGPPATPVPS